MRSPAWLQRITARLYARRKVVALVQCTHPNPPGFSPCNAYKITTCLTCKQRFKC